MLTTLVREYMPKLMNAISSDNICWEKQLIVVFFLCVFTKFILFNILWCRQTTFTPFSTVECWGNNFVFSLIIIFPLISFRSAKITLFLMLLSDILLIINLMYFRTYYTAIPLESYILAGNLTDFTDSVLASLRPVDLLFPLTTFIAGLTWWKKGRFLMQSSVSVKKRLGRVGSYVLFVILLFLFSNYRIYRYRDFKNAYASLQNANMYTCGTPMYTLLGSLYYDYLNTATSFSSEQKVMIEEWIADHPAYSNKNHPVQTKERKNCILILAESFESWVLEKEVEGQEITPYLNRWLKDSTTIFAPNVLSQVKGGRSIDGQLLCNTGLLPVSSGTYSTQFPDHYYPSLVKAFKEIYPENQAIILTVDKHIVWNQHRVAEAFGYDQIIDRSGFVSEEKTGPRKKTGDASFLRQCYEKIRSGEIWNPEGSNFLQCVTYSGHAPFVLPDELRRIDLKDEYPPLMRDYIIMANYTDYAIGQFLINLEKNGYLDNTMVIITGDHEGLTENRLSLCKSKAGNEFVSELPVVPFIGINSPVALRYEEIMGQVDIFPTLLDLFNFHNYAWRGLGNSILSPDRRGYAIDSSLRKVGKESEKEEREDYHRKAWEISDLLIRHDYVKNLCEIEE